MIFRCIHALVAQAALTVSAPTSSPRGVLDIARRTNVPKPSCQAPNQLIEPDAITTDNTLCMTQGKGSYTFSLFTTYISDTEDGGNWTGRFFIYDENCRAVGAYAAPDCGAPFVIEENFLKDVLIVDNFNMAADDSVYSFNYGDGKYSINNNHCICENSFVNQTVAITGCKCSFPESGHFTGR